jgi:hypothetical protein
VPVELALEQALSLLDCMEQLILSRESRGKDIQTSTLQYFNDLNRALGGRGF